MKKILSIIILLYANTLSISQTKIVVNENISGINTLQNIEILNTVAEFTTFSGNSTFISVAEILRGGFFHLYAGPDMADGGMIFSDALGRKWRRQTSDNFINIQWYGHIPYNNYTIDDAPGFIKAIDYVHKHKPKYSRVYAPGSGHSNAWYLIKTPIILQDIELFGDGQERQPQTLFQVFPNITAFIIPALNQKGEANFVNVKNLAVRHYAPVKVPDSSHHSFDIRTVVKFENVYVMQNEQGNGFNIQSCASPRSPIFGNADHATFTGCQAELSINGFFIQGCDANVILFTNCSAVSNFRWGVYDDGLLGNKYINCHFSNNGKAVNTGATLNGGKQTYFPLEHDSTWKIIGKRPDLHPEYWYLNSTGLGNVVAWDTTRKYYSGGPVLNKNINANSLFIGTYTESFQPASFINSRSVWMEGLNGADVKGNGMYEHTYGGIKYFSGGVAANKLAFVDADGSAGLSGTSKVSDVVNIQVTTSNRAEFRMGNTFDNKLGFTFFDSSIYLFETQGYYLKFNRNEITPLESDRTLNLGNETLRFGKIFADGSKLTFATTSGTAILRGGTVQVSTSAVLTKSKVIVSVKTPGGIQGFLSVPTIVNEVSFTINSTSATETSTVNWWIIN